MNDVLLLCTANVCRSVMAQGLLSARLAAREVHASVVSAGLLSAGRRPPAEVIAVMAARGIDVTGHSSRLVTADDLAAAVLILGLTREHVRHAVVMRPEVWPRAFTLRELVRRARTAGPRAPAEPLNGWLARAAAGRDRRELLGGDPRDDVPDPYGCRPAAYQAAARLIDEETRDLVALCWPDHGGRNTPAGQEAAWPAPCGQ